MRQQPPQQAILTIGAYARDGIFSGVNDVVERIIGTPPLTVQQFIAQNRAAFPEVGTDNGDMRNVARAG